MDEALLMGRPAGGLPYPSPTPLSLAADDLAGPQYLAAEVECLRAEIDLIQQELSTSGETTLSVASMDIELRLLEEELTLARAEAASLRRRVELRMALDQLLAAPEAGPQLLRQTLALLAPRLADWGVVDLLHADGKRRRKVYHPEQRHQALVTRLESIPPEHDPLWRAHTVAQHGAPRLLAQVTPRQFALGVSAESQEWLRELGLHSAVMLPLTACGRQLGTLTLIRGAHRPPFTPTTQPWLQELATTLALGLAARQPVKYLWGDQDGRA
jgi:hypothetical protein